MKKSIVPFYPKPNFFSQLKGKPTADPTEIELLARYKLSGEEIVELARKLPPTQPA